MITVFRGKYLYRFNGNIGTITNMDDDSTIMLDNDDTKFCNLSNANLDLIINREYNDTLGE